MKKNSKTVLIVCGVVVLGAIGIFVWPFGEGDGYSATSSSVVSPRGAEHLAESDVPEVARRNQSGEASTSTARLGAATDRSDDYAPMEGGTVAKEKKRDKNKPRRRNRKRKPEDEPLDQGSAPAKKKPPVGHVGDDL